MTAYRFTSHQQLRQILNNVETVHKKDINDYAGGHLNERCVLNAPSSFNRKSWSAAQQSPSPEPLKPILTSKPLKTHEKDSKMKNVLYDFSVGTTGSVPAHSGTTRKSVYSQRYKKDPSKRSTSTDSQHTLYSELDDGVLIEELKPQELLLPSPRTPTLSAKKLPLPEEDGYDVMEDIKKRLENSVSPMPVKHSFYPMPMVGVTRSDQYQKIRHFEATVLRKQDSSEKQVLSGTKAVSHLEHKLQDELDNLSFGGIGPNFHRLQVYSNIYEDLIEETPTFGYILTCIKTEYDGYISKLLDDQTPQHSRLLRDQVEQMSSRGTSRPKELQEAKTHVQTLEDDAQTLLRLNERLRREVQEESEWLANAPEPEPPQMKTSVYHDDAPAELADQIEHVKALILEKLDNLNDLRTKLREEYVPLTVCTHLEQCIKETEVEVQKLLKQNEYFERSIAEMEHDLKEAIIVADTSERDARRIWRKVNSTRGLPGVGQRQGSYEDSDEDQDDESKWNWYIS